MVVFKEKFTGSKGITLVLFFFIFGLIFNFLRVNSVDKEFAQIYLNLMIIAFPVITLTAFATRGKALPVADLSGDNVGAVSALGLGLGALYAVLASSTNSFFPVTSLKALAVTQQLYVTVSGLKSVFFIGFLAPAIEELLFLTFFFLTLYFLNGRFSQPVTLGLSLLVNGMVFSIFHFTAYAFAYPGMDLSLAGALTFVFTGAGLSALIFRISANLIGLYTESYLAPILFHSVINTVFISASGGFVPLNKLLFIVGGALIILAVGIVVRKEKKCK